MEQKAVSLKQLGVDAVIDRIYNLLIEQIFELEQEYKSSILNLWIEKLNIKGKSILVRGKDGDWVVKDVLEDCRLLLENSKNNDKLVVDNGDSVIYDLE